MKPEQPVEQPLSLNMNPYAGTWDKAAAAHLLRRTMFGATNQQILDAVSNGMNATVASLLQIPAVDVPLTYDPNEGIAAYGTTWINSVYPAATAQNQATETARIKSLGAWMMKRLNSPTLSIAEKMCLFWQNHFAATAASDSRATYQYHMLIRNHALGNFRQFIKDMTIDPTMLIFLNGATNFNFSPNENYARELLELYTIGKGPQIAPGDYTNYTEDDVAAGAKILTGWTVLGLRSDTIAAPYAQFFSAAHENSDKTLSYHFNNTVIPNADQNEYSNYIDVIFQQDAVAHFICTEIYRYFVNYDLTTDVTTNVIPVMAQTMISNNYEILPVMDQLLKSEHFYDLSLRGSLIRSPLEMVFGMFNATSSGPNFDLATDSDMYLNLYWIAETLGQAYATPPSVAGWTAYYQAPSFSKLWVNATHIKTRFDIANYITVFTGIPVNGNYLKINAIGFLNGLSTPSDCNAVISDMCEVFCPKTVNGVMQATLKAILINGVGATAEAAWSQQYFQYIGGDTSLETAIANRVQLTLSRLFKMPEFQTI
jgi:uncharacterized protein (DUF1800 family)